MDKECVKLCDAINTIPGLRTIESCCGHGNYEFRVWFIVEDLEDLPILLYYIDSCHVGFNWHCTVKTDCAMSPVHFFLYSECEGEAAYKQADEIADHITAYLKENVPEEQ